MKKKPKLSAIILTKNEERNIADCIASVQWADEVVVFDAFSQDRTVETAREAGATVFQHPFQNFAQQRNAALDAVDSDWIFFVDAVSQFMMGSAAKHEHAIYVESPTMLENVMIKVEFLIRKTKGNNHLVILDSINSMAIHNSTKMLSEFLHILVNNLRAKGAYTLIFSMEEYESEEITNMMNLVCDETISAAEV